MACSLGKCLAWSFQLSKSPGSQFHWDLTVENSSLSPWKHQEQCATMPTLPSPRGWMKENRTLTPPKADSIQVGLALLVPLTTSYSHCPLFGPSGKRSKKGCIFTIGYDKQGSRITNEYLQLQERVPHFPTHPR